MQWIVRSQKIMMVMILAASSMPLTAWSMGNTTNQPNSKGAAIPIGDQPAQADYTVQETVMGSKKIVWAQTLEILKQRGFDLAEANEKQGRLTTTERLVDLDTSYCVYGSTETPQAPLAAKTDTLVTFEFKIDDNNIAIRTAITAVRQQNGEMEKLDMLCVSRGKLERELISQIRQQVQAMTTE